MLNGKSITDYLFIQQRVEGHITHEDYVNSPGTAFLAYCLTAKDSIEFCKENFPKHDGNNKLKKDSIVKIQHIINSTLSLLMGHFETYQKYLFAGTFERTVQFRKFDSDKFFRLLRKNDSQKDSFNLSPIHLLAYRGEFAISGTLLADNLTSWHDPKEVNRYFNAFCFNKFQLFSNEDITDLQLLWQIRHSIVHTAATLTKPDAQKHSDLKKHGGMNIVFTNKMIYELSKRMHRLVSDVNQRLYSAVEDRLPVEMSETDRNNLISFYKVRSGVPAWLNQQRVSSA